MAGASEHMNFVEQAGDLSSISGHEPSNEKLSNDRSDINGDLLHDLNNKLALVTCRLELALEANADLQVKRNLEKARAAATKAVEMVRLLSQYENTGAVSKLER